MKSALMLLAIVSWSMSSTVHAQSLEQQGDRYTLIYTSPLPGKAHVSGNDFAQQIGDLLKKKYPSRVIEPTIKLEVIKYGVRPIFRLTWSCRIVPTTPGVHADWFFDRRGTLLSGQSLDDTKRRVDREIQQSGKVYELRRSFKDARIRPGYIQESSFGSLREGFWHLKEIFMTAPRPGP